MTDFDWMGLAEHLWREECYTDPQVAATYLREQIEAAFVARPTGARWSIGDKVQKKRGSSWRGTVVGFYSTEHTPVGYAVDSAFEPGSVQVWPSQALEDWDGRAPTELSGHSPPPVRATPTRNLPGETD